MNTFTLLSSFFLVKSFIVAVFRKSFKLMLLLLFSRKLDYFNKFYPYAFKGAYLRLYYLRMFFFLRNKSFINDTSYRYIYIKD